MTALDHVTVRFDGPAALRTRLYRALADALAATAPPCGILFEAPLSAPVPEVTVRPASLVETVRANPSVRGVRWTSSADPPELAPPPGGAEALRSLVVAPGSSPFPAPCGIDRELPDLGRLLGPDGWLGSQTIWFRGTDGGIAVARRFRAASPTRAELERRLPALEAGLAEEWADATQVPAVASPAPFGARRDWRRGTLRTFPGAAWVRVAFGGLARTAEVRRTGTDGEPAGLAGHRIVFGASGAGKTTYLAREAARHAARGGALVVIDLHGDLAPEIVARLGPRDRERAIAVDASQSPVPGVAALASGAVPEDRAAAHLVAALKRLSPDGTDVHWGFRLERIFDSFVRLVQESGGSLTDLYALLTEPDRRDAARLATRRPDLARFVEELGPVVKRQPDFLWSAATRLSKIVLVPALKELLAPPDGGLDVESLLEERRVLLVRLPFALLGPEAAAFAGTLVLARAYLGLAARRCSATARAPILFVLDEVHSFAPRLVAELLTESRKFGIRAWVATQYPDRLAPELRSAAGGALGDVVTFAVPHRSAGSIGEWVGLPPEAAERGLPLLPPGHGARLDRELGLVRSLAPAPPGPTQVEERWREAVGRTRSEFGIASESPPSGTSEEAATERLLLAILAASEEGRTLDREEAVGRVQGLPGPPTDPDLVRSVWTRAVDQGLLEEAGPGRRRLSAAGARRLGLTSPTGAVRESDEHRRLLLTTFRLFARRGYRIEILRQGRFDTTLPDAILRQLPGAPGRSPRELSEAIETARRGWAWGFFGGRDVHVEAEVSGALRPERIRHGWRKADARGAFALFVVGDAARARKVRSTLRELGVGRDRAQVWTLPGLAPRDPRSGRGA